MTADAASTEETPLIRVRDMGMFYWLKQGMFKRKRFWALRNISFDLHRGDSFGVIGKNGVGKTTLLRLLGGVVSPDEGTIEAPNVRASLLTLKLGFVDYLSGRENALLSGMFLGMRKKDIAARMDDIIEFAELGEFIDQPLSTYSSGMQARLGFAVAFQMDPDVLLVDEVTGVGDEDFRLKSFAMMRERIRSHRSTVVFVSHNQNHVRQLCSRAIWIERGEAQLCGDTDTVIKAYEQFLRERRKKAQGK